MKFLIPRTMAGALLAFALIMTSTAPAAAWGRSDGDFWTYDLAMELAGVAVNGTVTFEVIGEDTVVVGGLSYAVDVLSMEGAVSGSAELTASTLFLSADMSGFAYEVSDGFGTVKEEMYTLGNASWLVHSTTFASTFETEAVTTHGPPVLSGFDPDGDGAGGTWEEVVTTTATETIWSNGTRVSQNDSEVTSVYAVVLSGSPASVTTSAGTFECQSLTVTGEDGAVEMYWYSGAVGNFVKREAYRQGEAEPYEAMSLTEYGSGGGIDTLVVILVAGSVLVAGVVLLVAIMLRRRRPARPVSDRLAPPAEPSGER